MTRCASSSSVARRQRRARRRRRLDLGDRRGLGLRDELVHAEVALAGSPTNSVRVMSLR
jgi:hypothetical protein